MDGSLRLEVVRAAQLAPAQRAAVHALCQRAFDEDLTAAFAVLPGATHVLGTLGPVLASHAMWVTRWLQPGDGPLLRTAYVELLATEPGLQRRGLGAAVMRRLAAEIAGFDLGGLSPAEPQFYARLGWEFWRGPLFIRTAAGPLPPPDEQVMILRLPATPALALDLPLSAEWREGELW
jgi:aminoglycoside 2'-N-acetyltransferase I